MGEIERDVIQRGMKEKLKIEEPGECKLYVLVQIVKKAEEKDC